MEGEPAIREGLLGVDFDWVTQTDTSWLRNYTFLAIDKESMAAASLVLATKTGKVKRRSGQRPWCG